MKKLLLGVTSLSLLIAGCASEEIPDDESTSTDDENEDGVIPPDDPELDDPDEVDEEDLELLDAYGVSAGHPAAVDVGMEILENGGSAVDAAIAAAFAVSVVEPFTSGVGGGGVTLIQEQGQNAEAYDYREVVPEDGIPASGIGVPGFVAGMMELHQDYGSSEWQDLIDPAINLTSGTAVSDILSEQLQSFQDSLPVEELEHFYPGGSAIEAGANLEQSELAETLREIRDSNGTSFYEGNISESLAEVNGLSIESLSNFTVGRHDPVTGEFAGYEVIGAAPPLPGVSVIQMLQIIEERGILEEERNSTPFIHNIMMSWRIAQQFIETDLGDPSFVDVPVEQLTDPELNRALAEEIANDNLLSVDPELSYRDGDPNTTHITVIDADGIVVSMTNTLTDFFGSGEYTDGFFLNNQMTRFTIGQTEQNVPEAGRRSITWSSPMIIADEEGPVMGIGTPGGERIPTTLTQVIAHWATGETDLQEIVDAPRFHLTDNVLTIEGPIDAAQQNELFSIGYSEISEPFSPVYFGSIQVLTIDRETGELSGAADQRREGAWRIEATD